MYKELCTKGELYLARHTFLTPEQPVGGKRLPDDWK